MAPISENNPTDSNQAEERNTPPAFLDLADSSSRPGADIAAHIVHQKRLEHERLRQIHRSKFEEQMRLLEQQHAQEEIELLNIPSDIRHLAVSAPTTPPRVANILPGEFSEGSAVPDAQLSHIAHGYKMGNNVLFATGTQGATSDKRSSVNYSSGTDVNDRSAGLHVSQGYIGAKSMPASRRGSSDSRDGDDILVQGMQGLAMNDSGAIGSKPILRQAKTTSRFGEGEYPGGYNAGLMLDDELERDINQTIKFLHNSDEPSRNDPYSKLSASSAALDLAPLSQTPPRPNYMGRHMDVQKSSEWPSFQARPENPNRLSRTFGQANPTLAAPSDLGGKLTSGSPAPGIQSHSPVPSRRSSPRGLVSEGVLNNMNTRSVPATPLGAVPLNSTAMNSSQGIGQKPLTPVLPIGQEQGGIGQYGSMGAPGDRYSGNFDAGGYGLQHPIDERFDSGYGLGVNGDHRYQSGYGSGYDSNPRGGYGQGGGRYGMMAGRGMGAEGKMNGGFNGAKHKRGDGDRD
ncbi:hypothetical protein FRC17_006603, partial [Serendipita sp. 399]